jgi:hypothetical protein
MKNYSVIIVFLLLLTAGSCRPRLHYPADAPDNIKPNDLLTLDVGKNVIELQDYITEPFTIDSIDAGSEHIKINLSADKHRAEVEVDKNAENFINIQVWVKGVPFSIPCRKNNLRNYLFTFDPHDKRYDTVRIVGPMNDWDPSATPPLTLNSDGLYQIMLKLEPGTHPYQLTLDGNPTHDPNNPLIIEHKYGQSAVSILRVPGETGEKPSISVYACSDKMVTISYESAVDAIFIYWQNYRLPAVFSKITQDKIVFDIPAEAQSVAQSVIRVWVSNSAGISNGLSISPDGKQAVNND